MDGTHVLARSDARDVALRGSDVLHSPCRSSLPSPLFPPRSFLRWVDPLMARGNAQPLEMEDLWHVAEEVREMRRSEGGRGVGRGGGEGQRRRRWRNDLPPLTPVGAFPPPSAPPSFHGVQDKMSKLSQEFQAVYAAEAEKADGR